MEGLDRIAVLITHKGRIIDNPVQHVRIIGPGDVGMGPEQKVLRKLLRKFKCDEVLFFSLPPHLWQFCDALSMLQDFASQIHSGLLDNRCMLERFLGSLTILASTIQKNHAWSIQTTGTFYSTPLDSILTTLLGTPLTIFLSQKTHETAKEKGRLKKKKSK